MRTFNSLCVTDLLPYVLLLCLALVSSSTWLMSFTLPPELKAPALALAVQEHQHPTSQKHKLTKNAQCSSSSIQTHPKGLLEVAFSTSVLQ